MQIKAWDEAELDKPIDMEQIRIDPSPFQLVEKTSLHKVTSASPKYDFLDFQGADFHTLLPSVIETINNAFIMCLNMKQQHMSSFVEQGDLKHEKNTAKCLFLINRNK